MEKKLIWLAAIIIVLGSGYLLYESKSGEEPIPEVEDQEVPFKLVEEPKTTIIPNPSAIDAIRSKEKSEKVPAQLGPKNQLKGRVTDMGGQPIAGVKLTLFQYAYVKPARTGRIKVEHEEVVRESVTTNEDGGYVFVDLSDSPGPYFSMRIEKAGYSEVLKDGIGAGMIVDATLSKGLVFKGRIVDAKTGEPIPDVFCDLGLMNAGKTKHQYRRWRRQFTAKNDGTFEVNGVPEGNLSLFFEHRAYQWLFIKPDSDFWATANLAEEIEFKLKPGISLTAVVVDEATNQPIPECTATLREYIIPTRREVTGVFGKFGFKGLNPGRFELVLEAPGYSKLPMMLEVSEEALKKQQVFKMKPAGYASGVVVDPDGNPIPGAKIYVAKSVDIFRNVRGEAEARSDAQGVFTIDSLNDGKTYRFGVVADGYCIGVSTDFEAVAGEYVDGIIVQLTAGATMRGLVVDENEVPIKNVTVTLEQPQFRDVWFTPGMKDGQPRTLTLATNENGYWEFNGLWPGPYQVSMHHDDYVPLPPSKVFIEKYNDRIDQPVTLNKGKTIRGTVLLENGQPAAGITVTASIGRFRMNAVSTRTAADGSYVLSQLQDKNYRVKAQSDDGISAAVSDVSAGSSAVDLRIQSYGSLDGSVVAHQSGNPIERFKITIKPMHDLPDQADGPTPLDSRLAQKLMQIHESYVETTMVAPDGRFRIDRLEPGNYVVDVEAEDRVPMRHVSIVVQPSSMTSVKAFIMRDGASIHGTVKDADGRPINPSAVTIVVSPAPNSNMQTTTGPNGKKALAQGGSPWKGRGAEINKEGEFRVAGLPTGKVKLELQSTLYCCPEPEVITCSENSSSHRSFILQRGGKVVIQMTDPDGAEIRGVPAAQIFDANGKSARIDGRRISVQGGARGRMTVDKIAPGQYVAELKCFGYRHERVSFDITAGETKIIKAALEELR